MADVDTYRIGWRSSAYALRRTLYVRGIPGDKRVDAIRWAAGRLRRDLARLAAGGHRCGGWHAEPRTLPLPLERIGCSWTRRAALRDLDRKLTQAGA